MEKKIVLTIVFLSLGLLIRRMIKTFKEKDYSCCACKHRKKCIKSESSSIFCSNQPKEKENNL